MSPSFVASDPTATIISLPLDTSSAPAVAAPLRHPAPSRPLSPVDASALASDGIPSTALAAYVDAAAGRRSVDPGCGLTWPLLAAIGRVESDHGRFNGAVLHTDGVSSPRIIGIALDGHGTALVRDTDRGTLDGDTVYDRAVGPMQFIPGTWAAYGVDGNHDGRIDPFNLFDAAATAARYLCTAGGNLTTLAGELSALHAYNNSDAYIALVLGVEASYAAGGGITVPTAPTGALPVAAPRHVLPADPGAPIGISHTPATPPATQPTATTSTSGHSSMTTSSSTAPPGPSPSAAPSNSPSWSTSSPVSPSPQPAQSTHGSNAPTAP